MSDAERLLAHAAAAAGAVPAALGATGVGVGATAAVAAGADPFATAPVPGLLLAAPDAGGTGGIALALSPGAARVLAAAALGQDQAVRDDAGELSELERSAAAEAGAQALAAACAAAGLPTGPAVTRVLAAAGDADGALAADATHAAVTELTVLGERALLVLLVAGAHLVAPGTAPPAGTAHDAAAPAAPADAPHAFAPARAAAPPSPGGTAIGGAVLGTGLRVWAEVGRARLPVGRVVSLPAGSLVELDRLAEDPVDIYVNGHRYATGRLVVDDGGGWAVRLEELLGATSPAGA